ncbi:MAG: efflux RND transporter periplasmic adaptor subunit [Nodularia sp. CChRGM 3473]
MVPDSTAKGSAFFKPSSRQLIMLAVATSLAIAGTKAYKFWQSQPSETTPTSQVSIPQIKTVTALGRLEPKGKAIKLSAPASSQGSRVERLLVKEGDQVKTGQAIAILDNRDRLQAALTVLARIQATGSQQANVAAATLDRIAEVRPVDVAGAKAEVRRAIAAAKQAKANLAQAYVISPQDGVIFDIYTRSGEMVSSDGIVEIGQTNQMYAVVEIYQSDVSKVQPQQRVRISSNSLPGELLGTVDWVGWKVQQQNIINSDPTENIDSRVVEAHVQLDDISSQKAAKFTNLQVKAVIEL